MWVAVEWSSMILCISLIRRVTHVDDLVKAQCIHCPWIIYHMFFIFILFWSVNYIAFKVLLYLYGMLYPNGKTDHTITVTVTGSKQIRSGSDLTKSHDGMNHSRNRVRKTDQILNVTATTHKSHNGKDLYGNKKRNLSSVDIPQPCAYRRRLGIFT